jgi:hypothetical protein
MEWVCDSGMSSNKKYIENMEYLWGNLPVSVQLKDEERWSVKMLMVIQVLILVCFISSRIANCRQ